MVMRGCYGCLYLPCWYFWCTSSEALSVVILIEISEKPISIPKLKLHVLVALFSEAD